MSDAQPTALTDALEAIEAEALEEKAQVTEVQEVVSNENVDASDIAIKMGDDFGVDLSEVDGTGKDGRVIVPDVQKFIKARDEAAAKTEEELEKGADTQSDDQISDAESAGEPTTDEVTRFVPVEERIHQAAPFPNLPTQRVQLKEVHHIVRSVKEFGMGWDQPFVSNEEADDHIGEMLQEGWEIVHVQPLGFGPEGIEMFWVMGVRADVPERTTPYQEVRHIVRHVGSLGDDGRGVSGFQANDYINGMLNEGFDLALVRALGPSTGGGINMMWVMVR